MRSVVASHGPGSNPRGPNQTLEEISRHDIVGASSERRPAGGPATTKSRAPQGRTAARITAQPCAHPTACITSTSAAHRRPASDNRAASARSQGGRHRRNAAGSGASPVQLSAASALPRRATKRGQRASSSRAMRGQPAGFARARARGETAQVETDVGRTNDSGPDVEDHRVKTADETELWFNLSYEEFATIEANRPVEIRSDSEKEFVTEKVTATDVGVQTETGSDVFLVETSSEQKELFQGTETATAAPTADKNILDDESMTLEAILSTISDGFDEGDWYKASLPKINPADKGKAPLQERDPVKGNPVKEQFLLIVADIDLLVHFEGPNRDRGAVIDRSNTNRKSTCWIRTMLRINGTWVIEPCADYWQQIPRVVASSIVVIPSRLSYVDTLPSVGEFFKLLKKRWADVCIEAIEFCDSGKLLPVGSLNFCRAIAVVQPVSVFGSQMPTITSWGWSQLCAAFVRSVLRDVQVVTRSVSVAPSAQISLALAVNQFVQIATSSVFENQNVKIVINQRPHSPTTSDDSSIHFDDDEMATTPISLPAISTDFQSSFFDQLRRKDDTEKLKDILVMHIRDLEKQVNARFDEHDRAYKVLLTNIRKDMHDHKTALSLDVVRSHQKLSTQVAAVAFDLDGQVATVRSELLDFRAKPEENHNTLSTQLGFLVDYIDRGGNDKKVEDSSSRRPYPTPDDQARPSGGSASREGGNSGGRGSESSSGSKRRRGSGDGSRDRQHSSGGGSGSDRVTYGPYLPPKRSAKYWIYGEKEF
ncbi:AAA-type ATPase [Dorcoceras hygrometricum]|uniref:AAA-type ATPase n=1 Tax=Dorcoceras hygrometricum TaxID=472368 RepID=A0A2Z7DFH0_9LAMI|nr:AAA-type ATPase [Dorcoceras hygrometricum]